MSLWKVISTSQVARQVSAAELPAGSFVWGKEGFKWISGNSSSSSSSSEGVQKNPWENQSVEHQQEPLQAGDSSQQHQPSANVGNF